MNITFLHQLMTLYTDKCMESNIQTTTMVEIVFINILI